MRIGPKVVATFLAVSLVPTALLIWHGNRSVRDLGDELADRARSFLEGEVSAEIRAATVTAADRIEQRVRLVELALDYQVRETADVLTGPPPAVTPYPYVLDAAAAGDGSGDGDPVQRIVLAGDIDPDAASEMVQRLSLLTPVYKTLAARHPDLLRRMFVTLETGVHAVFPAGEAAPTASDPREHPLYWRTLEAGDRLWTPMRRDDGGGDRLITASAPVTLADGRYAGVAGIELRVVDLLAEVQQEDRLPPGSRGRLLLGLDDGGPPQVVARLEPATGMHDWQAATEGAARLAGDAPWARLLDGADGSGAERVRLDGEDSLVAYAPIALGDSARAMLLIGVPYRQVAEEANAADAIVRSAIDDQLRWSGIIAVTVMVGVVVLAVLAARRLTRPVEQLAAASDRLARGDFHTRVELAGSDEFGDLAQRFNRIAPRLGEMFEVEKSLALARDVQQHLLPARPPRLDGFDISGVSIYCDETGGDYLDYIELERAGRGRLGIAVGDVSGHGVPAALMMTTARALLRGYAVEALHACDLVDEVNVQLVRDIQGGQFMTLFLVVISRETQSLEYVSAGHEPAFYYCPGDDDFHDLEEGGIPLGIDAKWHYQSHTVEGCMTPGRVLVIGTDGLWETRNPAGEMFGKERLRALVRTHHRETAERIRVAITDAVQTFRGAGEPATDDLTVAVVKVLDGPESPADDAAAAPDATDVNA